MSASDHLSLEQFKGLRSMDHGVAMHQVESEGLLDRHISRGTEFPTDKGYRPDHPHGYNDRLMGVSESVAKEGIKEPVTLSRFVSQSGEEHLSVWDGHHRGVAAIRHNVDPVPVKVRDMEDLTKGRWG